MNGGIPMNIIICGAGKTGAHAAEILATDGANVTVIDESQSALDALADSLDVATLLGGKHVAVRGGMLCAEPYVRSINENGLVRASVSFYNDELDIEIFEKRLIEVCQRLKKSKTK